MREFKCASFLSTLHLFENPKTTLICTRQGRTLEVDRKRLIKTALEKVERNKTEQLFVAQVYFISQNV